ncbi:MAG TPA: hypothetical protein GX401_06515 [Clostridiales bacterium]|nr:hypothetical protein [Clostridiales bacterium]
MKKIIVLLCALMCMLMCGCMKEQINTIPQELKASVWKGEDDFNKGAVLSFDGDTATLLLKNGDDKVSIIGNAMIDDTAVTITDEALAEEFTFNYVLYGDKIEITYDNSTITLDRVKNSVVPTDSTTQ